MSRNSESDATSSSKTKRRKSKSAKAKSRKSRKPRLTKAEKAERAKQAFFEVEENKTKPQETSVMPVSLLTDEEIAAMTRENSFLLNPVVANASLQYDLINASSRAKDLENLHKYLFDPMNQTHMEDKTLVSLYAIAIQDHHKTNSEKIKLAEMSDKARLLREAAKFYTEQENRKEMRDIDNSHTSEIVHALLSESMRKAMEDEISKKWGGSNSYKPAEKIKYEIMSVDPNADD